MITSKPKVVDNGYIKISSVSCIMWMISFKHNYEKCEKYEM